MNRTELINTVISRLNLKSYCEIGVSVGRNFAAIKCHRKVGVDPDVNSKATIFKTSDDFFENNKEMFDCYFLDGLHHADQVRRDIINSYNHLNNGGCLVIHDTNPATEEITAVPRETKEWCGDVYKAIYQITSPFFFTMQDDHGVTVIRKSGELKINDFDISWSDFNEDRELILNLVTAGQAIKIVESWK